MTNPYQTLQLDKNSPIEVIRAKYKELKDKYLEDRFLPGVAGNEAAHKLTELETAIKIIEADHISEESKRGSEALCFVEINNLINNKQYNDAQDALDAINNHCAEWHYLQAMLFYRREWAKEAKIQLDMALNLEPHNQKYIQAQERLKTVMGNPKTPPQNLGQNSLNDPLDPLGGGRAGRLCGPCGTCCMATACLNCCCPMLGGNMCGGGMCG